MRLRRYTFKASGTIKDAKHTASIMMDSLNRGPDSIVQRMCPYGIIVQDKNMIHELDFSVSADDNSITEVKVGAHDWLPKHQKDTIRKCLQMAADKTDCGISIDGNMKYASTDENLPEYFYHITEKKSLPAIMGEGIVPKRGHNDWKSKKRCAYLTEAEYIVPWLGILDNVEDPVILEVDTSKLASVEQGRIWEDRPYVPGHIYSEHRTTDTISADAVRIMSPDEIKALGVNEKAVAQFLYMAGKKPDNMDMTNENEVKLCMDRLKEMGVMDDKTYNHAMDTADFAKQVNQMQEPDSLGAGLPF